MKKDKSLKKYGIIILFVFGLSVIGFTSAWFIIGYLGGNNLDINVSVSSTPFLEFSNTGDLNLIADANNFVASDNIIVGSDVSATLSSPEEFESIYNIYFKINSNTFEYTTDERYPELLLIITDRDGVVITDVPGLDYKTYEGQSGFDITTISCGTYIIKDDISIVSDGDGAVVDSYKFELLFVNLGETVNQNANFNKEMSSEVLMEETKLDIDNQYCSFKYLGETAISSNGGVDFIESKGEPSFLDSPGTDDGMYATEDFYGTAYYFRGAVFDNWVNFAGYAWRILRVNGDGSVRLVFYGSEVNKTNDVSDLFGIDHIGYSSFNSKGTTAEYGGYMFTEDMSKGLTDDSTIKEFIDNFYVSSLLEYEHYYVDSYFCYERDYYTTASGLTSIDGYGSNYNSKFSSTYVRLVTNNSPTLLCNDRLDTYTVSDDIIGNAALTYPIALLSADDIVFAGAPTSGYNSYFYLATNNSTWLGSPARSYYYSTTNYFKVYSSWTGAGLNPYPISTSYMVMPVISVKVNTVVSGIGTSSDPYIVESIDNSYF